MADRFAVTGRQAACEGTPGEHALNVFSTGGVRRGDLYDFVLSVGGTPADNALQWLIMRTTAVGTEGAGVVPTALNGGPASSFDGAEDHSAEPTFTAGTELLDQIINQRQTFRWVAAPGGGLQLVATTANGIGFRAFHASYTGTFEVTTHFEE